MVQAANGTPITGPILQEKPREFYEEFQEEGEHWVTRQVEEVLWNQALSVCANMESVHQI